MSMKENHLLNYLMHHTIHERRILPNVDNTNVKRVGIIYDLVNTEGLVSYWLWEYPKFSWDHKMLTQWEGERRFYELIWIKNKVCKKSSRNQKFQSKNILVLLIISSLNEEFTRF